MGLSGFSCGNLFIRPYDFKEALFCFVLRLLAHVPIWRPSFLLLEKRIVNLLLRCINSHPQDFIGTQKLLLNLFAMGLFALDLIELLVTQSDERKLSELLAQQMARPPSRFSLSLLRFSELIQFQQPIPRRIFSWIQQ
jgi:hypothetical protein